MLMLLSWADLEIWLFRNGGNLLGLAWDLRMSLDFGRVLLRGSFAAVCAGDAGSSSDYVAEDRDWSCWKRFLARSRMLSSLFRLTILWIFSSMRTWKSGFWSN